MNAYLEEIREVLLLSLGTCTVSLSLVFIFGLPLTLFLFLKKFSRKNLILALCQSLLFIPSVTLGLLLYFLLRRNGVLGSLELLYTPGALIIGQFLLIIPLFVALSYHLLRSLGTEYLEQVISLGANFFQLGFAVFRKCRPQILAAVIICGSRVLSETSMAMILGGNIKGQTRLFTTAIVLHTMRGEFEIAVLLGLVLFLISAGLGFLFILFQKDGTAD